MKHFYANSVLLLQKFLSWAIRSIWQCWSPFPEPLARHQFTLRGDRRYGASTSCSVLVYIPAFTGTHCTCSRRDGQAELTCTLFVWQQVDNVVVCRNLGCYSQNFAYRMHTVGVNFGICTNSYLRYALFAKTAVSYWLRKKVLSEQHLWLV